MSGHSKWSTIKRKKGKADAERGRLFTKLIKEITVAARQGGGDIDANPRLRTAINISKGSNMPADNIKKAIMKGTGELPGVTYEDVSYEGYGPAGVAVLVEGMTDNKNRTVAEVRHLFDKYNGNLGENGCVAWIFERCGLFEIPKSVISEDDLMEIALDAGASDIQSDGDNFEVYTDLKNFEPVRAVLEKKSIEMLNAEVTMIPQNTVKLDGKSAETMIKLYEALEDNDDVQKVYANFDISDEILEKLSG